MTIGTKVTHVMFRGGMVVHLLGSKEQVKESIRAAHAQGNVMVDVEMQGDGTSFNPVTILTWSIDMILDDHELGVEGSGREMPGKDTGFVIDAEKVGEVVI